MKSDNITGIILAGGKNARMGVDKGLLTYNGKTFIECIIELLKPYCKEIIIVSNNDNFNHLGYKIITDNYTNIGPLAGLEAGLKSSKTERNLFLTCDSPTIKKEFIEQLITTTNESDILYLTHKKDIFPLTAVYNQSVLYIIESQIQKNNLRVKDLLNLTLSKNIEISEPILNFNTPEDLQSL